MFGSGGLTLPLEWLIVGIFCLTLIKKTILASSDVKIRHFPFFYYLTQKEDAEQPVSEFAKFIFL